MTQRKSQNGYKLLKSMSEEEKSDKSTKLGSNSIEVENIITFAKIDLLTKMLEDNIKHLKSV